VRGARSSTIVLVATSGRREGEGKHTFQFDVFVNIFFESFVIVVDLRLVFYNVAFGCVEWWIYGDDAALVTCVFDFLRSSVSRATELGERVYYSDLFEEGGIVQSALAHEFGVAVELVAAIARDWSCVVVLIC
jgi:hypothetical protein